MLHCVELGEGSEFWVYYAVLFASLNMDFCINFDFSDFH